MTAFQGVTCRCIYEEEGKETGPAIVLAYTDLQTFVLVLVVHSDHMIEAGSAYKDAIIEAKKLGDNGKIVLLCIPSDKPDKRYGWIEHNGNEVTNFVENSRITETNDLPYLQSSGILVFENDVFQKRIANNSVYDNYVGAYQKKKDEDHP